MQMIKIYGKLPLHFEESPDGEESRFLSRGLGYGLHLTSEGMTLVLAKREPMVKELPEVSFPTTNEVAKFKQPFVPPSLVKMRLLGANTDPKISGEEMLAGKSNYFIGNDPKKWRTNVSNYKKVRYQEVYPGIDLVYYGNQRKLEYDFIVKPGADPKIIQLSFEGIESYSIENGGDLVLHTAHEDVTQKKPVIYQEIEGKRVQVAGNYIFLDDESVAFHLGKYDKSQPLVIDPVLEFSTILGGRISFFINFWQIALDSTDSLIVVGKTRSIDFPVTVGAFDNVCTPFPGAMSCLDTFITKLNANGRLEFSTYLGGSGSETIKELVVDSADGIVVAGTTESIDFPITPGAFDDTCSTESSTTSCSEVFIAKLNSDGTPVFSTYLGGNGFEDSGKLALDSKDRIVATGITSSLDFPLTPEAFDDSCATDEEAIFCVEPFITKLNQDGTPVFSTYLGGDGFADNSVLPFDRPFGLLIVPGQGYEFIRHLTLDSADRIVVAGTTESIEFPVTSGAFDDTCTIGSSTTYCSDAFITKLNSDGTPVFSTYLGGSRFDFIGQLAIDSTDRIVVGGGSSSTDLPITVGVFDDACTIVPGPTSCFDNFITKLNTDGTPVFSTYLGGSGSEFFGQLILDSADRIIVKGTY